MLLPTGRSHCLAPFLLLSALAAPEEAGSVKVIVDEVTLAVAEPKCEVGLVVIVVVLVLVVEIVRRSTGLAD